MLAPRKTLRHRRQHEERDEEADAAVGHHGAREHDRQDRMTRAQLLDDEVRDRLGGAAVIHELAEQRAEQEQGKELTEKLRRAGHERLRPMGEQGLPRERRHDERCRGRQEENAPATIGERDQHSDSEKYAHQPHCPSTRSSLVSNCKHLSTAARARETAAQASVS
jgi:hypothetical protein